MYKIASLESLHFPLIKKDCKTKPLIISTGTLSNKEIEKLVNFLKKIKFKKFVILHLRDRISCKLRKCKTKNNPAYKK